jgi:hypothetical protein
VTDLSCAKPACLGRHWTDPSRAKPDEIRPSSSVTDLPRAIMGHTHPVPNLCRIWGPLFCFIKIILLHHCQYTAGLLNSPTYWRRPVVTVIIMIIIVLWDVIKCNCRASL